MKKSSLFFTVIFTVSIIVFFLSCQTIQSPPITRVTGILEFPNMSKTTIYDRINVWAVKNFVLADAVIEYSNKESGIIAGKYVFKPTDFDAFEMVILTGVSLIKDSLVFEVRDGKMRFNIDLIGAYITGDRYNSGWNYNFANATGFDEEAFVGHCKELMRSLRDYILNTKDFDW